MLSPSISLEGLRELIWAEQLKCATIRATTAAFIITVQAGKGERTLAAVRNGQPRQFKSIEHAVRFLRDLGMTHMKLDIKHWKPRTATAKAPAH